MGTFEIIGLISSEEEAKEVKFTAKVAVTMCHVLDLRENQKKQRAEKED